MMQPTFNPQGRPPHGMTPQMPVRPRPPQQSSLPFGFPLLAQGRVGLVVAGRTTIPVFRWPTAFSQIVDRVPHNTFVWVFGETNGWALIHHNNQFGFIDSRFVLLF